MQLNLGFRKTLRPGPNVWAALEDEHRIVVFDVLARLIAQAAQLELRTEKEENNDE